MAPLHFAVRQGYTDVALALIDAGVDVNLLEGRRPGVAAAHRDGQRPLRSGCRRCSIAAPIPNLAAENGVTPLYAVLNLRWAQEAGYPQPWAHLDQKTSYLAYMKRLLDAGADPNLRLSKKVWYSGYNFDLPGSTR